MDQHQAAATHHSRGRQQLYQQEVQTEAWTALQALVAVCAKSVKLILGTLRCPAHLVNKALEFSIPAQAIEVDCARLAAYPPLEATCSSVPSCWCCVVYCHISRLQLLICDLYTNCWSQVGRQAGTWHHAAQDQQLACCAL